MRERWIFMKDNFYNPRPGYQFIHGCYVNNDKDAVVADIKNLETGKSELAIVPNPVLPFWITKPGLRNYSSKREYSPISELDQFVTPYRNLNQAMCNALGYFGYAPRYNQILKSPYIYGARLTPDARMKMEYFDAAEGIIPPLTFGALDIEVSVIEATEGQINVASYADGKSHVVYCCILKSFLKPNYTIEHLRKKWETEYYNFLDKLKPHIKLRLKPQRFEVKLVFCDTELQLITYLFKAVNYCQPDFCSIWNLNFDMPHILKRIEANHADPKKIICHPDVPKEFRTVEYNEDTSVCEHITQHWHTCTIPGYTYYYDSMCLYARRRAALPKESSYALGEIATSTIGASKMDFEGKATHYVMQTDRFDEYCVYNTFDVILLIVMEEELSDLDAMMSLSGLSPIQDFAKQTVRLSNEFYNYSLANGGVISSVCGSIKSLVDYKVIKLGGAVLDANLARNTGFNHPTLGPTTVQMYVCDLDAKSEYPSITQAANISKETKLFTTLQIKNIPGYYDTWHGSAEKAKAYALAHPKKPYEPEHVAHYLNAIEDYFANVVSPEENAEYLCNKYFGLPTYIEMLELIKKALEP